MTIMTRLAIAASAAALLGSPAFAQQSQPTAINGQVQLGDVFSSMTVVAPINARSAVSSSIAAGNSVSGANLTGGLRARSTQEMSGAGFSWAEVQAGNAREITAVSTAQGNTGEAQVNGGDLDLVASQTSGPKDMYSGARVNAGNAQTLTAVSSAAQNNAATGATNGDLNVNLTQRASGSSYAITDVDACCTGTTLAGATATGNTYGSTSETSTVNARYNQTSTGAQILASTDVYQNRGYDVVASSTAAGNSANVDNKWGYAEIRGRQANDSAVNSETRVQLATWSGTASLSSHGVGNTSLVTNVGSDLAVDVSQVNNGYVGSDANFTGSTSEAGAVVLNSTAIGNAFTGYVCSQCGDAAVSGSVRQVNAGNVASAGSITVNGPASGGNAQIAGSATAIGNSASFITTTRP
jgi:hypothetical protein